MPRANVPLPQCGWLHNYTGSFNILTALSLLRSPEYMKLQQYPGALCHHYMIILRYQINDQSHAAASHNIGRNDTTSTARWRQSCFKSKKKRQHVVYSRNVSTPCESLSSITNGDRMWFKYTLIVIDFFDIHDWSTKCKSTSGYTCKDWIYTHIEFCHLW